MPARDPNCLFCRIIDGQIPSAKLFENDAALAFLDINPVNQGHVLLVPKEHHPSIYELSDDLAAQTAMVLPRLARAIQKATSAHGLNIIINNGRVAGQTIDHGHWHLIPRFADDHVRWPWPHTPYTGDELAEMKARIDRELASRDD